MNWLKNRKETSELATRWCCIGFKSHYESAGNSGYSYLVGLDSLGDPEFLIQFRAVDRGSEDLVQSSTKIVVISDMRIVFCPSCGVNLTDWYGRIVKELFREGLEIGTLKRSAPLILGDPEGW